MSRSAGRLAAVRAECISFLTDYGLDDGFVAACKGVLLARAPGVPVLDVTHLVPPGDVRRGAAVLAQTLPYLPPGVHVAVVDPGVGTARRPVVVVTPRGLLVGPDNGVLSWPADALGGATVAYVIDAVRLGVTRTSATFHGRDVFAPAAGELARGLPPEEVGEPVDPAGLVRLPRPRYVDADGGVDVEVVTVDRFGNVMLAAGPDALPLRPGAQAAVNGDRIPYVTTFADVEPGEPLLYVDAAGALALAVRDGSAAAFFGASAGDLVRIRPVAGRS